MRSSSILAALCLAAACSPAERTSPVDGDIRITIEQRQTGPWRATFELATPRAELDLGPSIGGYRVAHWRIEGAGAHLVSRSGRDFIEPAGVNALEKFTILIEPAPSAMRKDYDPFIVMGDGGVLFYSGHIIPWISAIERMDARLTVIAGKGASVSAFGETTPRFDDWRSPFDHPAFVYVGPTAPVETDALLLIVDATAPDWISKEVAVFAPSIAAALQDLLQRALATKPNIFVAIGDLSEDGRLNYSGDALPGQYQMTLVGGGWKTASPEALSVLRRSTAHEAAHLWQAARPKSESVPDWIHEGGADALAAAAMVSAGYWTEAERLADFAAARAKCAASLRGLSLQRAEAEARWGAVYACGHVLNVAAAGKEGVAALWREIVRLGAKDGYDEALFLALAEHRAGEDAADAIRHLIRINEARPDRVIDRMLAPRASLDVAEGR